MAAQVSLAMIKERPFKALGRIVAWAFFEGRPLTTRGRWINPFVFFLFRLYRLLPINKNAYKPIYIVGTGRSGTTFLGTLFSFHKETMFLNEPKALWHYAFGDEDVIGSYSKSFGKFRISPKGTSTRKMLSVYSAAMVFGLAKRIVDKYPELIFRVRPILSILPNARFLVLVRDGVDTCSSVVSWSSRKGVDQGAERHDWWGKSDQKWLTIVSELVPEHPDLLEIQSVILAMDDHRDRAAIEWIISMREALSICGEHEECLMVRYESLCQEPESTISRICKHCGVGEDIDLYNYADQVLLPADSYSKLYLRSEICEPFKDMLKVLGYEHSTNRVVARHD